MAAPVAAHGVGNASMNASSPLGLANSTKPRWRCPTPRKEPVLRALIGSLFAEGLVPPGSVIDAGANSGEETCFYAERQPQRTIHAIEPLWTHYRRIKQVLVRRLPNIQPLHGGLGSTARLVRNDASPTAEVATRRSTNYTTRRNTVKGPLSRQVSLNNIETVEPLPNASSARGSDVFRVHRIDDLFAEQWRGETLGFMHLDVEGGELDVLNGARATIMRDRPMFTVEAFVHNHANATAELMSTIEQLGYVSLMVEEQCGIPADCRNILNLPRERIAHFDQSVTLMLAMAGSQVYQVLPRTIAQTAYAPACAPGELCCKGGPEGIGYVQDWWRTDCCAPRCVQDWLSNLRGARASARHAWVGFGSGLPLFMRPGHWTR